MVKGKNILHYEGSLTTPNCDEIVNWFVNTEVIYINPKDLRNIKAHIYHGTDDNRPVQPLHGRKVTSIISEETNTSPLPFILRNLHRLEAYHGKKDKNI